jgi:hypothetical protein
MLLAVYYGRVSVSSDEGFNTWLTSEGAVSGPHLDWLLDDGYITGPAVDGTRTNSTLTVTGESLLVLVHGIIPESAPGPDANAVGDVLGVAVQMTDKRANALYDVRQGYITAAGTTGSGKTAWASTSHDRPTGSLAWLLENGLITHDPVPADGSSPVTITPLGENVLLAIAGIPPLAATRISVSLSDDVDRVLRAAGTRRVRVMAVIGGAIPEVHIMAHGDDDEAAVLNAAGKALLEHGGFDVRVGYDGYKDIVLTVHGNPDAAPRQGVSDTHITDVLAASGR